jgi:hypothetical protein
LPTARHEAGLQWWAQIVWNATEHIRRRLPHTPKRKLRHHSLLTGLGTESFCFDALAMHVHTEIGLDRKRASWHWCSVSNQTHTHWFDDFDDMLSGDAICRQHSKACDLQLGPDLVTIGLSCQPFSTSRAHSKTAPRDHDLFGVTFDLFPRYLRRVRPLGFVAEQVAGFDRPDPDDDTGNTFLKKFGAAAASCGYHVRVLELDSGTFCESGRPRFPAAT